MAVVIYNTIEPQTCPTTYFTVSDRRDKIPCTKCGYKLNVSLFPILQNQLTIHSPTVPAKPGQHPQPTPPPPQVQVQLPTTPHPNPMTPSPAQPSPAPSDHGGPPLPPPQAPSDGGSNDQEQAISAIMASLIKDSAQFEKDKSILQPQPSPTPGQPPLLSPSAATAAAAGGSSLSATAAMLPTCPVPPASLAGATSVVKTVGTTTTAAAGGNMTATGGVGGLKVVNRVSLQTLLSTPVVQQQQATVASPSPTKGSTQLSAALSRPPVVSLPPTYTQALQAQQQQQQPVAIATATRSRIVQQQQPLQQQPSMVRKSLSGSEQPKPSLSQDAPGLQALLANAPSADSGGNNNETNNAPTPSLLERLVTGQPVSSPSATPIRAISTQSTSQVGGNVIQTSPCADSTQEITLAAILAKPPSSVGSASSPSPTKASPLLQQLQQPVQQCPRGQQAQLQQQQSIVSPLRQHQSQQQPQLSPASSTRSQPSPRMIQPSPSPRPAGSFALPPQSPKEQQHLMQPPGSQQQASIRPQQPSILSATLQQQQQQPIMTLPVQDLVAVSQPQPNGILNGGQQQQTAQPQNVVSLQNLLQSGMVQVSTSSVAMQPGSSTTGNNMVLQIPGLADPVTLSVNMPQQQQQATLQQKQQMPMPMVTTAVKFTTPQAVVLQQAGASGTNSFIQLPQQPTAAAAAGLKQQATVVSKAGQVLQVQHRQQPQQQVFVNLQPGQQVVGPAGPGGSQGQPIQIVRTVRGPGGPGQQAGTTMQLQLNSAALKGPQQHQQQDDHPQGPPQLPPPIQSPSPSGSSLTSPPDGSAAVVLSDPQPKNGNLGKVRQQRKQSLK